MKLSCLAAFVAISTTPLLAEQSGVSTSDFGGWQYDATFPDHLPDTAAPGAPDVNAINDLLTKGRDAWNAGDVDGYMSAYWNSAELLVVIDNQQYRGWKALNAAFKGGYPDLKRLGQITYTRIQVRITSSDLALVKTAWTGRSPNSSSQIVGSTTMNIQKFEEGWKVVSAYSSFVRSTSRGWEYDSIAPDLGATNTPSPEHDDLKTINDLLLRMLDRWNAHDIDGYLSAFWQSPQLLVMLQEEQFQGWQSVWDTYKTGYPDPNAMGSVQPSRIQIKLVKPDLAVAVTWWVVTYPNSKVRVVGNSTMNLEKFSEGWRIALLHSSYLEP